MLDKKNDIATRLDQLPVTRFHLGILVLCTFGLTFDLFEVGIGNALGAVFSAEPHSVSTQALSWLLASAYIGAILGASVFGWVADRVGRRLVLGGLLWLLTVTAGLASLSSDVTWLTVSRMLVGLTLGAFPPLLLAYLTDLLPARNRGRLMLLTVSVSFVGAPAGVFVIRMLTPVQPLGIEAWRWCLALGAVGAGVCAFLFMRYLPESPRWLVLQGRETEAEAVLQKFERSAPMSSRVAPEPTGIAARPAVRPVAASSIRQRFIKFSALCFLSPWSSAAFPLLMGAVLTEKGFKLSDTLLFVGLSTFGPTLGTLLAAFGIDRTGRRTALAACAVIMLIAGVAFAMSDTPSPLVISSTIFLMCAAVTVPMLNIYGAELFSTAHRASAVTGAWAFNRLGAALAPLLLVPLLRGSGTWTMMTAVLLTVVGTLVLLGVSERGRAGNSVE
jgi:MFS transporter, putative metabolite:H+ symporter